MNLSKKEIKLVSSLQQKKYRQKYKLFVAEGVKVVKELLDSSFVLHQLYLTDDIFLTITESKRKQITEVDLKKISQLKTPNKVVGLFQIPEPLSVLEEGLTLALDDINDPGNLGTIIRLCDWFGVDQLVCSKDTVDCFNQKVVQATMGSLARVRISYVDLLPYLKKATRPIFIADMDGDNLYKTSLPAQAVLVMGNEANGISSEISNLKNTCISIPRFGNLQQTESLNVATATAIILSEFKRV
ncbi:RNA methyltransferase [Polaribacter pacificus]|uniref:RNA methyltransferase n=1 Tax=Polaribacter pacificus TaxID=1775173 RepID=A0A917HWD5_9FLAO|nr:RNA methyltransferase [Polaribacter pacificus]GGG90752.1 RNA methyltransferase [Polaribacter pacificus]